MPFARNDLIDSRKVMKTISIKNVLLASLPALAAAAVCLLWTPAQAAIIVSEVAPWSSGNSPVAADWFELTNTGSSAVNISGWMVDDSSNAFATAFALSGITSIGAGESVIFVEGASPNALFLANWFGSNAPAGLQLGHYSGAGLGLSTAGDGVNIFNASGVPQASVSFGAASAGLTFDNAAGLTGSISQLSVLGVNGAFVAINSATEIGSPGRVSAVPEASSIAMLLAGLVGLGALARQRRA
jgi:Lamin Tail Domain